MKKLVLIVMGIGMFSGVAMAGPQWGAPSVHVPGVTGGTVKGRDIKLQYDKCKSLLGTWALLGTGLNTGRTWIIKHDNTIASSRTNSYYKIFFIPSHAKINNSANFDFSSRKMTVFIHEKVGGNDAFFLYSGVMNKSCSLISGTSVNEFGSSWSFQLKRK